MIEFVRTDVLVIGGGIAGMRAGLAARAEGVEVTILAKKKIGKSGASLVANTGHRLFPSVSSPEVDYIEQTHQSGQGLAEKDLVQILAAESLEVIEELQSWGCPIELEYYHDGQQAEPIPHYARCPERKGLLLTQVLRQRCLEAGLLFRESYTVIKLIKEKGRVIGAFATYQDQIYGFLAKAVVLATGGVGRLYQATDNPVDLAGETLGLAWEVGAELMDLEFVQFYPYQLKSPVSMDIHTSVFRLGAYLLNEHGDRFMEEYPKKELETRDLVSREMFLQEGEIYLDLMDVDLEKLRQVNPQIIQYYFEDQDLLVCPIQHFFMGGVRMDLHGRSTVPGLYVCGEAAAGIHGANRLGGNALTECSVFGRRAGQSAARETQDLILDFSEQQLAEWVKQLSLPKAGHDQYLMMHTRLQHIMWDAVGIVRDGERMRSALREIENKECQLMRSQPRSITEWYQTKNMLVAAQLITEAALERTESRGAHYRLDYPETDPAWLGHIIIVGDEIIFEQR